LGRFRGDNLNLNHTVGLVSARLRIEIASIFKSVSGTHPIVYSTLVLQTFQYTVMVHIEHLSHDMRHLKRTSLKLTARGILEEVRLSTR
jgi:hypothetical protein